MANILEEVQHYVAAKLSSDTSLSDCTFLVENIKDIDYEIKNALGRQGIVGVVMTPKATYAGKYEDLFLSWTLEELEIDIVENPTVNRGKRTSYITGQDAAMRLFDVLCPLSGDYEGQFNPVSYEEGEDSGLIVNRCILKALVYGEHGDTPQPEPGLNMVFVKLLDGPPTKPPHDGWMWPTDDGFVVWQNGQQHMLGNLTFNAMSAYVAQELSGYLPAEIYGLNKEYATVRKVVEITDPRSQPTNEPVLTLAQNGAERSLEIIDTNSLATFNFGVVSSGIPKISFGIDDPETFNTLYFPDENGTLATQEWTSSQLSDFALTSQIPTKTSQLSNDSGFITSAQVQPATYQNVYPAFAQNAVAATKLNAFDTQSLAVSEKANFNAQVTYNQSSNTYDLVLKGQVAVPNNWNISKLFNETFSPSLTLSWRRGTIYRKRVIGSTVRWSIVYNNGWMWLLNGRYAMTASAEGEEDGKLYVLNYEDETHPNYINDPATDVHTLTFSFDNFTKVIATVDGQTEQATGSRNTLNSRIAFSDDLAYVHQLSAKADLSAFSNYLPLSGGTMSGDIDMGGQHADAGVEPKDSAFLKFMEYHLGYGEFGSGFGIYHSDGQSLSAAYLFNDSEQPEEYDVVRGKDLPYTFEEGDLEAPAIELPNRTNTIVSAQQSVDINLAFESTGDGKMSDMWLNVYCPLSVTSPITINWPHAAVPKDGDYDNLSVQLSAWNTYMIVEKRPGTFMVAREVEELS